MYIFNYLSPELISFTDFGPLDFSLDDFHKSLCPEQIDHSNKISANQIRTNDLITQVKWIVFEASTVLDQSGTNGINVGVYCLARLAGSSVEMGSPKLHTLCLVTKPVESNEYMPK